MALPQLSHETLRYGTHSLQTISVATGPNNSPTGLWVVLIHGGAWRDPLQTATSFLAPIASILHSSSFYTTTTNTAQQIAAFASISYRLSPHPDQPQDPSSTDPCELRDAKHPEHSRDVRTALRLLQSTYGFGERYVLVGHSCGATLGFQCVMPEFDSNTAITTSNGGGGGGGGGGDGGGGVSAGDDGDGFAHPLAILGTEGIYDLRRLRDTYSHISTYQELVEGAFGPDESIWDVVSPAVRGQDEAGGIERGWRVGRLAMLAHSVEDSLVDAGQVALMKDSLVPWEKLGGPGRKVLTLALIGEHDDPWEKGDELARAIAVTIHELQQLLLVGS